MNTPVFASDVIALLTRQAKTFLPLNTQPMNPTAFVFLLMSTTTPLPEMSFGGIKAQAMLADRREML